MPEIDRGTVDGVLVCTDARVGLKLSGWLIRTPQGVHRVGTVWHTADVLAHIWVSEGEVKAATKHGKVYLLLPARTTTVMAHAR